MSTYEERASQAWRIAVAGLPPPIRQLYEEASLSVFPETAKLFGHSRNHAYELVATGRIPALRHGTKVRISTRWIREALGWPDVPPGFAEALDSLERAEDQAAETLAQAGKAPRKARAPRVAAE